MTAKSLKKWLKKIPDNYELDLSTIFMLKGEEDVLACVLDYPIVAIADSKELKHFRFVLNPKEENFDEIADALGKITRIE